MVSLGGGTEYLSISFVVQMCYLTRHESSSSFLAQVNVVDQTKYAVANPS